MTTETTRKLVQDMFAAIIKEGPRKAFERYMVEDCILHNPRALKGREGAVAYVEDEVARGSKVTVKRMIVDGDMVAVHMHMAFTDGSPELAIVDMWRFANGKAVEHWDISQAIPKTSAYDNTMF